MPLFLPRDCNSASTRLLCCQQVIFERVPDKIEARLANGVRI